MNDFHEPPKTFSPDDALPPVEPPSAGFLVQLFLIPGIIVAIIVAVWLLFHWLAQMGNDPREYVRKLRSNSETRWQAAVNLAGVLHSAAGADVKRDAALAGELGEILSDEIRKGGMDEGSVNMRIYLSRALGEFEVDAGLPALLQAATTERAEEEVDVRRAAVQGIAALAATMRAIGQPLKSEEAVQALIQATKSDHPRLRAESAYALGFFDDAPAKGRLQEMLADTHPDARFNAATGLAEFGQVDALPVLLEMTEPDQSMALEDEKSAEAKREKRIMINVNGLKALVALARAHPDADLSRARENVEKLTKSDLPEVRSAALATQEQLGSRAEKTSP